MKLEESLRAALASTHIVTDPADIARIREPILEYQNVGCPFIDFRPEKYTEEFEFLSESAHVITKATKGDTEDVTSFADREPSEVTPRHVRHVKKAPGRKLIVPGLRIETRIRIPFLNSLFRDDKQLADLSTRMPERLSGQFLFRLQYHIFWAMFASAEAQNRIKEVEPMDVQQTVGDLVDGIHGPSSIIVNFRDLEKVRTINWPNLELGSEGTIRPSSAIGEGVVIVVPDSPEQVGFVRVQTEPETFTFVDNVSDGISTMVGVYGFCIWGDAPITKVDFRNKSDR